MQAHTHAHAHARTHARTHKRTKTRIRASVHARADPAARAHARLERTHACLHTLARTHARTHARTLTYTHARAHTDAYVHRRLRTRSLSLSLSLSPSLSLSHTHTHRRRFPPSEDALNHAFATAKEQARPPHTGDGSGDVPPPQKRRAGEGSPPRRVPSSAVRRDDITSPSFTLRTSPGIPAAPHPLCGASAPVVSESPVPGPRPPTPSSRSPRICPAPATDPSHVRVISESYPSQCICPSQTAGASESVYAPLRLG